jgi:multisubunit Na+/H+ antiporter MnhF subunit
MLASVITFLIYICLLAIVIYLVIWVLRDIVGLPIPEKVVQLLWVIVALIAILWLVQMVLGGGGFHLPALGK